MNATIAWEHQKALRFSHRIQSSLFSMSFLVLVAHGITTANFLSQLTLPAALFVGAIVYGGISFLLTMIFATPVEYLIGVLLRMFSRPQARDTLWGEGKAPSP